MRFVTVGDLRAKSGEIWRDLPAEHDMVITSNGRPVALLTAVDESNVEEALAASRQARAIAAMAAMQQESVRTGRHLMTADEIDAEVAAVRERRDA